MSEDFEQIGNPKKSAEAFTRLFPHLRAQFERYWPWVEKEQRPEPQVSELTLHATVDRYLANLRRMRDLVVANGGRFVSVLQPMAETHSNVDHSVFDVYWTKRRFRDAVVGRDVQDPDFHDFSSLFDRYYAQIPVLKGDAMEDTIFVDATHLYDPGNAIVARELWRIVWVAKRRQGASVNGVCASLWLSGIPFASVVRLSRLFGPRPCQAGHDPMR